MQLTSTLCFDSTTEGRQVEVELDVCGWSDIKDEVEVHLHRAFRLFLFLNSQFDIFGHHKSNHIGSVGLISETNGQAEHRTALSTKVIAIER